MSKKSFQFSEFAPVWIIVNSIKNTPYALISVFLCGCSVFQTNALDSRQPNSAAHQTPATPAITTTSDKEPTSLTPPTPASNSIPAQAPAPVQTPVVSPVTVLTPAPLSAPCLPPVTSTQQLAVFNDLENQINEFQRNLSTTYLGHETLLRDQEIAHEAFLESCYKWTAGFISLIAAALGLFIAYVGWKSKAEIEEKVNVAVNDAIKGRTQKAIDVLEAEIKSEFKADIHNITEVASVLARASALLNLPVLTDPKEKENLASEQEETAQDLTVILNKWCPTNRTITVFIGRLYKAVKNYQEAIKILGIVISRRRIAGENKGAHAKDFAAILFNHACYNSLMADELAAKNENEACEEKRKTAWLTISESVEAWPIYYAEAVKDPDFKNLPNASRVWENIKPK